ncbi:hypothetical protein KIPB_014132, partial [Kipferlia bialata]
LSDTVSALSAYVGTKPGTWQGVDTLTSKAEQGESDITDLSAYVDAPNGWTATDTTLTASLSGLAEPDTWTGTDPTLTATVDTLDTYVAVPDAWTESDDTLTKQVEDVWLMDYDSVSSGQTDFFTEDTAGKTYDIEGLANIYATSSQACAGYIEAQDKSGVWHSIVYVMSTYVNGIVPRLEETTPLHIQPGVAYRAGWHAGSDAACVMACHFLPRS